MSNLEKAFDVLADLIADKVVAKMSGTAPAKATTATKGVPPEADPPETVDQDDPAPAAEETPKKRTRTRKSAKAEDKADDKPAEDSDDVPMVTAEQMELVREECESYDPELAKSELLDFYISQGHTKAAASTNIAEASAEEILQAHIAYSAGLLCLQEDGSYDYVEDYSKPYQADRTIGGKTVKCWANFSTTLTPEEVEEQGLDAPAKKKRTRKAKA